MWVGFLCMAYVGSDQLALGIDTSAVHVVDASTLEVGGCKLWVFAHIYIYIYISISFAFVFAWERSWPAVA